MSSKTLSHNLNSAFIFALMQKVTGILILMLAAPVLSAQNPVKILEASYIKCQSVQNGYYEMNHRFKFMDRSDTLVKVFKCNFRKEPEDTIYGFVFHYRHFNGNGDLSTEVLYNGLMQVNCYGQSKEAIVMNMEAHAEDINDYKHNFKFYTALTNSTSEPLSIYKNITDTTHRVKYLGIEQIKNKAAHHIQVQRITADMAEPSMKYLRIQSDFWINVADSIPVQYARAYDIVQQGVDTVYQYEWIRLEQYQVNSLPADYQFTIDSIADSFVRKEYTPYKMPEPLPSDTLAPDFRLPDLAGDTLSLGDFRGKLVLLDFFYKGCYPCMQAIPELVRLHEHYYEKGLRIIGLNPYDNSASGIAAFLKKRGVAYTVLLEAKATALNYRVAAYPTVYLINRDGKVIESSIGFGPETGEALEKLILENL